MCDSPYNSPHTSNYLVRGVSLKKKYLLILFGDFFYMISHRAVVCVFLITRFTQVTALLVTCEFNKKIFTTSTWRLPLHNPTLGNCMCVFLLITRSAQVIALPVVCEFNEKIFTASTWRLPLYNSTLSSCVCVCVFVCFSL